eukprot:scaffold557343_cov32-Prasinocladus_malaysianus.AAC.1
MKVPNEVGQLRSMPCAYWLTHSSRTKIPVWECGDMMNGPYIQGDVSYRTVRRVRYCDAGSRGQLSPKCDGGNYRTAIALAGIFSVS